MHHKNPLVRGIKESKNVAELKAAIEKLGVDAVQYSSEIDNQKLLPYEYCRFYHFGKRDFEGMYEAILKLMMQQKIKPLNELMDAKAIIAEYKIKGDLVMSDNIQVACEAINYARGIIKVSSTHPTINNLTATERNKIDINYEMIISQRVHTMRSEFGDGDKLPEFKSARHMKRYLSYFEEFSKKTGYGNCGDFSRIIFLYIARKHPKLIQSVRFIKEGDHWFNQLGTGESAVYCDGFLGVACPVSQMHVLLKDIVGIERGDSYYNCLLPFNSSHHKIETEFNNTMLLQRLPSINIHSMRLLSKVKPVEKTFRKDKNKLTRSLSFP